MYTVWGGGIISNSPDGIKCMLCMEDDNILPPGLSVIVQSFVYEICDFGDLDDGYRGTPEHLVLL